MDKDTESLLERIRQGDESAFDILVNEYDKLIENAVRRFLPSFNIVFNPTAQCMQENDNQFVSTKTGDGDPVFGTDDIRQCAIIALYRAASTYSPNYCRNSDEKNGILEQFGDCGSQADYFDEINESQSDDDDGVSFGFYAKICINNALISALRRHKSEQRKKMRMREKAERTSVDPLMKIVNDENEAELKAKIASVLSNFEREVLNLYILGKSTREIADRLGKDYKSISNAIYRMRVKIKGLLKN